jgi:putative colanic acid biosynthesis UDP-glucose lipid carrier transferase
MEVARAGAGGRSSGSLLRAGQPRAAGLIRPHHSKLSALSRIIDASWVWIALWLSLSIWGHRWTDVYVVAAALGTVFFVTLAEVREVYRAWRGAALGQEIGRLLSAWVGTAVLLVCVAFVAKRSSEFSRLATLGWFVLTPVLVTGWRLFLRVGLRALRSQGHNVRTVAVGGAGDLGVRLMKNFLGSPWMGMKPVGYFDDRKPKGFKPIDGDATAVEGDLDEMVHRACSGEIDLVYLALPLRAEARMRQIIGALSDSAVSVYVVPDLFCFDLLNARLVNFGGVPTVSVFESPFEGVEGWVKRVEDILLASLILLLIAVPMLVITLGIKLTSRGPVIFRQRRYGLDGKEITVWKFRTMTVCEDGVEFHQARKNDPRVTRFGAFLRKTSLDELPQFFNVLAGTMSVVGPRPHPVALNEEYRKRIHGYMLRHKVKPGITGWAQINGFRGETDDISKMEKRVEHDFWYIRNWSLWLDIKIVALSVVKGFISQNAY